MPRGGSAPGERRGGRRAGTPNKHTAEIKSVAQAYGPSAITVLAEMAGLAGSARAESEPARIAAIKELLDRGFGKATQPLSGDADAPPLHVEFTWAKAIQQTIEQDVIEEDAAADVLVTFATRQEE